MPFATLNGLRFAYEVTGAGAPLVLCHEFAGDMASWEPQVRYFSRRYQVITYNARGYPPTDVPADWGAYTYDHQVADLHALLRHLGIPQAIIAGLSMGGYTTLAFAMAHPAMCRALIVAGAGGGATQPGSYREGRARRAEAVEQQGMRALDSYAIGPARIRYKEKDPAGWQAFYDQLMSHDAKGSANTLRGYQASRPPLFSFEDQLRQLPMPVLVMVGDDDVACLDVGLFLKRVIPRSGLAMLPQSGHAINIEEPALFNQLVAGFLSQVEAGQWGPLPPGSDDL